MTAKIVDVAIVVTLPKLHSTHSGVFRPLSSMTCMTELSERYGISSPSFLSEVFTTLTMLYLGGPSPGDRFQYTLRL